MDGFVEAESILDAWYQVLRLVSKQGEKTWDDGEELLELRNLVVAIEDLGGDEDTLEPFFESCGREVFDVVQETFSDLKVRNKEINVSYAQRIYNHHGINQVDRVIEKLKKNPHSKSATFSLLNPSLDSAHVPCISCIDFKIRDGRLAMTVFARAIDGIKKFPADLFALANIQKTISNVLELDKAPTTLFIGSLHVYERDYNTLVTLLGTRK